MKKLLLVNLLIFSFLIMSSMSQSKVDSLVKVSLSGKADTNVCKALHILSSHYRQTDFVKSMEYGKREMVVSQMIGRKENIALSLYDIGNSFYYKGDYDQALVSYMEAIKIYEGINDKKTLPYIIIGVGDIDNSLKRYDQSLKYYFMALKIGDEVNNVSLIAESSDEIANVFSEMKDKSNAEMYYLKALSIMEKLNHKQDLSIMYANMGAFYSDNGDIDKGIWYSYKALYLDDSLSNESGSGIVLNNMAGMYVNKKDYNKALVMYNKALRIANVIQYKELTENIYQGMSDLYEMSGNTSKALEYHKLYSNIKDSIFNEGSNKQIAEMNTKYETEKKDKQIIVQESNISKQQAEASMQQSQRNIFIAGFILASMLVLFFFKGYRQKHKANRQLDIKNKKIEIAYKVIEEKKKEITDSINYAVRIQNAILPSDKEIKEVLPESFVLFKPKDVVSGDFYFFKEYGCDAYIAVADCTGHGVPGAMMSMICSEKLKDSVNSHDKGRVKTGNALSYLNDGIKKALHQSDANDSTKDGMDIALCYVDTCGRVEYSGANRPLWIVRKGSKEVEEIKATKMAIGGYTPEGQKFQTHSIDMEAGDCLYLFSDGYADQFGGDKGKKFTTARLKDLLIKINNLPMDEQKEYMEYVSDEWRKSGEQVDDILVIGVKM